VQDGLGRPLAYASRQTNKSEQSYTTSELKILTLVWATKQFRCYLHGHTFLARTGHAALTFLREFADQNTRLLRWSIKLSGLDFIVECRVGLKMGHVDALNRHVGSVAHENTLDRKYPQSKRKMPSATNTRILSQPKRILRQRRYFIQAQIKWQSSVSSTCIFSTIGHERKSCISVHCPPWN